MPPWWIGLAIVGFGVASILRPMWFYSGRQKIYKESYLKSPRTRLSNRVFGFIVVQAGLLMVVPSFWHGLFPSIDVQAAYRAQFQLFLLLFLTLWSAGMIAIVMYVLPWSRPWIKTKLLIESEDVEATSSDHKQILIMAALIPVIPLLALAWMLLGG